MAYLLLLSNKMDQGDELKKVTKKTQKPKKKDQRQ